MQEKCWRRQEDSRRIIRKMKIMTEVAKRPVIVRVIIETIDMGTLNFRTKIKHKKLLVNEQKQGKKVVRKLLR